MNLEGETMIPDLSQKSRKKIQSWRNEMAKYPFLFSFKIGFSFASTRTKDQDRYIVATKAGRYVSANAKHVLLALMDYQNRETGKLNVTNESLAHYMGWSIRKTTKGLEELKKTFPDFIKFHYYRPHPTCTRRQIVLMMEALIFFVLENSNDYKPGTVCQQTTQSFYKEICTTINKETLLNSDSGLAPLSGLRKKFFQLGRVRDLKERIENSRIEERFNKVENTNDNNAIQINPSNNSESGGLNMDNGFDPKKLLERIQQHTHYGTNTVMPKSENWLEQTHSSNKPSKPHPRPLTEREVAEQNAKKRQEEERKKRETYIEAMQKKAEENTPLTKGQARKIRVQKLREKHPDWAEVCMREKCTLRELQIRMLENLEYDPWNKSQTKIFNPNCHPRYGFCNEEWRDSLFISAMKSWMPPAGYRYSKRELIVMKKARVVADELKAVYADYIMAQYGAIDEEKLFMNNICSTKWGPVRYKKWVDNGGIRPQNCGNMRARSWKLAKPKYKPDRNYAPRKSLEQLFAENRDALEQAILNGLYDDCKKVIK